VAGFRSGPLLLEQPTAAVASRTIMKTRLLKPSIRPVSPIGTRHLLDARQEVIATDP
jgi:hypothetical protein